MIIIYDNTGKIWYNGSGDSKPDGLPFLEYTPVNNKFAEKVDLSGKEPTIVFKDYPKSEMQLMKESNEKQQADIDYLMLLNEMSIS